MTQMSENATTTSVRQGWFARLRGKESAPPRVPDGTRVYAVGDIHGRLDLLEILLTKISAHAGTAERQNSLVFLGDYVDRGQQSKQVIDHLLGLSWPGWKMVFLRGNHDQAILDFLEDAAFYRVWKDFGAADTLVSYGVKPPRFDTAEAISETRKEFATKCPAKHLEFLRGLEYSHIIGDYMFVHAGVRPGIALDRQSPQDLMWIRDEFLISDRRLDKVIVHGHTPTERPVRRANRIGVDTGAYATNCLTSVVLEGDNCVFLNTDETVEGS
ncbi:MAG: metallophosphoesterase family protein [Rhizomicrobium sp.]